MCGLLRESVIKQLMHRNECIWQVFHIKEYNTSITLTYCCKTMRPSICKVFLVGGLFDIHVVDGRDRAITSRLS